GDQRGLLLSVLGEVNRTGSPPAVDATQTSRWYLLSFSFTVWTVNATRPPSGDIAGALSVASLYQSLRAKARLAGCWPTSANTGVQMAARLASVRRMETPWRGMRENLTAGRGLRAEG